MKTTSIKTGYLTADELKQAIVEYLAKEHEELAQHLYDNDCSMEWDADGNFVVSIDGEFSETGVFPEAGNTDYSHNRSSCVVYQEGGIGCPDCYDFICDGCGAKSESKEYKAIKTKQLSGVVMCEECASGDATQNDVGWIRTLCESCRENYDKIRAKRWEE